MIHPIQEPSGRALSFERIGDYKNAIANALKSYQLDNSPEHYHHMNMMIGMSLLTEGRDEDSVPLFLSCLLSDPYKYYTQPVSMLIKIAEKQNNLEIISKIFDIYSASDEVSFAVSYVSQQILSSDFGLEGVVDLCERYLAERGPNPQALLTLGSAYKIKGKFSQAEACFQKALSEKIGLYFLQNMSMIEQMPLETDPLAESSPVTNVFISGARKKRLNVLIISTCQGKVLNYAINKILSETYEVEVVCLLDYIDDQWKVIHENDEFFKSVDVLIHETSGINARYKVDGIPAFIIPFISDKCLKIGMPSIVFYSLWPMVYENNVIVSSSHLKNIVDAGIEGPDLISMYDQGAINFTFEKRLDKSIKVVKYLERSSSFIVSDFIEENLSKKYMFASHIHPEYNIHVEIVHRIVDMLISNGVSISRDFARSITSSRDVVEYARRVSSCEYLPCDRNSFEYFKFEWARRDGASDFHSRKYYHFLLSNIKKRNWKICADE